MSTGAHSFMTADVPNSLKHPHTDERKEQVRSTLVARRKLSLLGQTVMLLLSSADLDSPQGGERALYIQTEEYVGSQKGRSTHIPTQIIERRQEQE